MNVFIVYAHHEPRSFNGAMRDTAVTELAALGHQLQVSDLYAMRFKAWTDGDDFLKRIRPDFLKYQSEQKHVFETDSFSPDIKAEQEKLLWCDILILQFPLYWQGLPAILKGWIDRVLAVGFAYGGGRWYNSGPLRGRKALVATTTGGLADRFRADALFGDIDWILHPLRVGTLNFVGLDTLEPFIAWGPASVGDDKRQEYLAAWRQKLRMLEHEQPQPFRNLADYPDPKLRDH